MTIEVRQAIVLATILIFTLLAAGCAQEIVCAPPNKIIDGVCCTDSNDDGNCDTPDDIPAEKPQQETADDLAESPSGIEEFADKFAKAWNTKSYNTLYNFFDRNYRLKYKQQEFNYMARKADANLQINRVRLQKVEDNEAFYTVTEGTTERTVVAETVTEDGNYRHTAFYFFEDIDADSVCIDDDDCFMELAVIPQNINLCHKAGELRLDCLDTLGTSKTLQAKIDTCTAMKDYYTKVECLNDMAVKENTFEPCWEAEFNKQKFMCMGYVVAKRGDPAECKEAVASKGYVATREQHAYCILGYVKETHDTTACKLIDRKDDEVVGAMQESCYKENFP